MKGVGPPKYRRSTHPGEILHTEFLEPMGISLEEFVRRLGGSWTESKLREIIDEQRGISTEIALDFSRTLKTTPQFWLALQKSYDTSPTKHGS